LEGWQAGLSLGLTGAIALAVAGATIAAAVSAWRSQAAEGWPGRQETVRALLVASLRHAIGLDRDP
jgi:hypothetical protein